MQFSYNTNNKLWLRVSDKNDEYVRFYHWAGGKATLTDIFNKDGSHTYGKGGV